MSGKIFDLTPESEGPRHPVRRSASWEYGSSAGEVYLARKRALERAADDALLGAQWVVRRREARGQTGGEDAVTLALTRPPRGYGGPEWEQEVRRAMALQAEGTAYLARKREERLRRQAAEAAEAGVVQAQAEVGREGGALSPELSGRIQAKRGGGQPLDATVRRGMEGVFQVSFGHVRIHADPEADALNRGVAAIAFTVGSDIFFRAGAYQPHSAAGQHLLAHELTHVVQQRRGSLGTSGGGSGSTMTVGAADDRPEQEAEATAHRVTATLQRRALLAQATTPGAGIARRHDPVTALAPAAPGVARVAAPNATIQRWLWDDAINTVKRKVDDFLRGQPGFELLTVLLGQDPLTGRHVARTPQSLAHAVLSLVPGGDALYQKLEEYKVLTKLFSWFNTNLASLAAKVRTIPHHLGQVLGSLGLDLGDDFNRIKGVFTGVMGDLVSFAKGAVGKVAGVAVQAIMAAFGPMGERVYEALKNAGAAMMQILRDPGAFLHNLGEALKQDGGGFVQHIGAHLKEGLISLLTNGLFGAGVALPAHLSLDAPGVITLALDLLHLGWDHLISLLRSRLGPRGHKVVSLIQAGSQELGPAASLVQDLRKGPLAFAHHLVESMGDLTGLLFAQVGDWLKTQMLPKMIVKLISMVVPGFGVASALLSIYEGISFLISHMGEIAALVNRVIGALGRIMAGDIGPAAQAIEDAMARTLPLVLKFLFRLMGINIDSIGDRIKSFLGGIRKRIDAALTKLLDFIVKHIPARLITHNPRHTSSGHGGSPGPGAPATSLTLQQQLDHVMVAALHALVKYSGKRERASDLQPTLDDVKQSTPYSAYKIQALKPVPHGEHWAIYGKINPEKIGETHILVDTATAQAALPHVGMTGRIELTSEAVRQAALKELDQITSPAQVDPALVSLARQEPDILDRYKGKIGNDGYIQYIHGIKIHEKFDLPLTYLKRRATTKKGKANEAQWIAEAYPGVPKNNITFEVEQEDGTIKNRIPDIFTDAYVGDCKDEEKLYFSGQLRDSYLIAKHKPYLSERPRKVLRRDGKPLDGRIRKFVLVTRRNTTLSGPLTDALDEIKRVID